jgi:hypothetical protein
VFSLQPQQVGGTCQTVLQDIPDKNKPIKLLRKCRPEAAVKRQQFPYIIAPSAKKFNKKQKSIPRRHLIPMVKNYPVFPAPGAAHRGKRVRGE